MAIDSVETLGNQSMTEPCRAILASRGGLLRGDRVLDFGCGLGRHVREFRAAGYDAVGVDRRADHLVAGWEDLPADDRDNLHFSDSTGIPFPAESFDFCYSTSVFEHVMEYDKPISEMARVLKPGAWTLHVFPARWRPVEPHIFTPFGGRFQHPALISLWARIGIRNPSQRRRRLSAAETASRNLAYSKDGINYPTRQDIARFFGCHFSHVEFVEREFVAATRNASQASRLLSPVISWPGVESLYRGLHTRVVLARKA